MKRFYVPIIVLVAFIFFFSYSKVNAHEQYVLTQQQLEKSLSDNTQNVLSALNSSQNITIGFFVGIGIVIVLFLNFFFQYSKLGRYIDSQLKRLENLGHFAVRISLGLSLLASAFYNSYLGPEILASSLRLPVFFVPVLYILGLLLILGLFTRVASIIGVIILIVATKYYGEYMLTYFNYYGEYLALIIFGSYYLSSDNKFFGISKLVNKYKNWEILILRVTYGISVLYPAITIKLMHPAVIIEIYNKYELGKIWWLFPPDALLTSLGTGLVQVAVGVLVIIGFQTRMASLITFLLYLGSIIFFKEAVWPHLVLLALAFYFVINNGGSYTMDRFIDKKYFIKKVKKNG